MSNELSCEEFVELVTAFLEGELDESTERRFIEHLALCEGCETYLDQFRQTIQALGHLPPGTIAPDVRERLLTAFRNWIA